MVRVNTRCKKCLITEKCPDTKLDSEKICNHCRKVEAGEIPSTPHFMPDADKRKYVSELDTILRNTRGERAYDCIVGFSGGKDSLYLIHRLRKEYPHLRILAVTVIIGLIFNEKAEKNLKEALGRLDVDHVSIRPRDSFFVKFYRYLIENRPKGGYKRGSYDSKTITAENAGLCVYCHGLVHDVMLNYAAEHRIPLHITGASPGQPLYWFFSQSKEELSRSNVPEFMMNDPFDDLDRSYCWDPGRYPESAIPTVLFPFHVWDYNSEQIRQEIYDAGLISSLKNTSMLKTNCKLNFLMAYVDMHVEGYFNMQPYLSFLIRHKLADRKKWVVPMFLLDNFLVKQEKPVIRQIEKILGIDKEALIDKFRRQKQRDDISAATHCER